MPEVRDKAREMLDEFRGVMGSVGLLDTILPPVLFLVLNSLLGFQAAIWGALILVAAIAGLRVLRKQPLSYALWGIASVILAIALAWFFGRSEGFFLPDIVNNGITVALALVSLVMIALVLTAFISAFAPAAGHRIHGLEYGPEVTSARLASFLLNTVRTAFITLLALIILAGYAAIASLVTRSTLGGLMASFGISMLDSLALPLLGLIGNIIHRPELVKLYPYSPSYNLSNLQSWLLRGHAADTFTIGVSMPTAGWGFWGSALILGLWILGLVCCALYIFQRQELTE